MVNKCNCNNPLPSKLNLQSKLNENFQKKIQSPNQSELNKLLLSQKINKKPGDFSCETGFGSSIPDDAVLKQLNNFEKALGELEISLNKLIDEPAKVPLILKELIDYTTADDNSTAYMYVDNNGVATKLSISELLNIFVQEGIYNYSSLSNKPKINGVELEGDKSFEDLGIHAIPETMYDSMITIPAVTFK